MNTPNPFPTAAPDFSDPLGLLRACHERIFQHCDMVEGLAVHLLNKGADRQAGEAAAKIHRYFSTAGKHHHEDEEQDLFPRLAAHSRELAEAVQQLKQEHDQLDTLWSEIEPQLAKPTAIEDPRAFQALAQRLAEAYRSHARKENEGVLTQAAHILDSDELEQLGRKMARRRGTSLPAGN